MKIKICLIACLFLIINSTLAQGIRFETGKWANILAKAKEVNKPIFVDAYTVWCVPCKKMDKEVFTLESVGQYMNEQFVSYKMDMEKGEGVDFAVKHGVTAFPTLLFFDSTGQLMYKSVGYKDAEKLIQTAEKALDPQNHIESFRLEYENSDKSLKSLISYCKKLRESDNYNLAREVAMARLSKLKKSEKYTFEEWTLTVNYVRNYEDALFKDFLKNKKKYLRIVDPLEVNKYIHQVLGNTALFYRNKEDQGQSLQDYLKIVNDLKKYINSNYYIARANYFTHLDSSDKDLLPYACQFLDQDFKLDYDEGKTAYYLVFMANRFLNLEEKTYREAAWRWAIKSVRLDSKDYKNKFVLAQLYYQKGELNQALKYAEEALEIEKDYIEAGVIKKLFKAESIPPFIEKIKKQID